MRAGHWCEDVRVTTDLCGRLVCIRLGLNQPTEMDTSADVECWTWKILVSLRTVGHPRSCRWERPPRRPVAGGPAAPASRMRRAVLGRPPSPAGRRPAASADPTQPAVGTMSSYRGMDASLQLRFALCCHSNATRVPIANPPNSTQLRAASTTPPSYIRIRAVVWVSCRPSVRLSQVGVLLKWLNVGSRKQSHKIARKLWFSDAENIGKIKTGSPKTQTEAPNAGGVG